MLRRLLGADRKPRCESGTRYKRARFVTLAPFPAGEQEMIGRDIETRVML
jgi:hypothetical protein